MAKFGFVGLGRMGVEMAANLLKAGHEVLVFNRTIKKADPLKTLGALVAHSPREVCEGAGVVFSILADDASTEEIALGPQGLVRNMEEGAVHACMATISVELALKLAEAHRTVDQGYVSAPVFGRPPAAAAAKLFVVASGKSRSIEKCMPGFEAMSQKVFTLGEGCEEANVVKIAGNFMLASLIESLGEAFALTRNYAIDPNLFLEVLTGTIFPAPVYKIYGGMIAKDSYEPAGFKLPLGLKDVGLALEAGERKGVALPLASLVRDRILTALSRGYEEFDWAGIARVSADDAGLQPLK